METLTNTQANPEQSVTPDTEGERDTATVVSEQAPVERQVYQKPIMEGVITPRQGGEVALLAARVAADNMTAEQARAHELHESGNDQQAANKQEWAVMPSAPLVTHPESGNTAFVQPLRQDVMDTLHDDALKEDAARAEASAATPAPKKGFLARLGFGRKQ